MDPHPRVLSMKHSADLQPPHNISQEHLAAIYQYLTGMNFSSTSSVDLGRPVARPAFRGTYSFTVAVLVYSGLVIFGLVGNLSVLMASKKKMLYKGNNTLACVMNLAACNVFQLVFVVPLSTFVLLVQNWVLGSVVCYILPMLQVRENMVLQPSFVWSWS